MGYANGNIQIINGQEYTMYSPAWYAAMQAEAQRSSAAAGTAAGSQLAAASAASGIPINGSASSSSTGGTGTPGTSSGPAPTVAPPSLQGLTAATGGGIVAPSGVQSGSQGGATAGHSHLAPVDTTAAETASFNKAKDQVGQEATGALTGLRSALGGRNLLGSGQESRATASLATGAESQLGDVTRQQAVTRADEAQKNAETNFQGDISQRGQDFQKEEAGNSLAGQLAMAGAQNAVTQRGQDITDRNAQKALEIEQAQLGAQQRSTALAGLEAALKISSPGSGMY